MPWEPTEVKCAYKGLKGENWEGAVPEASRKREMESQVQKEKRGMGWQSLPTPAILPINKSSQSKGRFPKQTITAWAPGKESARQLRAHSESDQRTERPTLVQGDLFKGAEEKNFVKTIRVLSNSPHFFFFSIVNYFLARLSAQAGFSFFGIWIYICSTVFPS